MTQPLTRRSTLKAGAHAAWMVPAVQVVSATPAFAASGADVQISGVSSDWVATGLDTYRADRLTTTFTLTNNGVSSADDLVVSLLVPAGLYESAPSLVDLPNDYTAGSVTGSGGSGWTLQAVRALPLAASGTTGPVTLTMQFNDPVDTVPYRAWAGHAFTGAVAVDSSTAPGVNAPTVVPESAPTLLEIQLYGSRSGYDVTVSGSIRNIGGKTSGGPVTLTAWWEPSGAPDDMWDGAPGATAIPDVESGLTGGDRSGSGSALDPWAYTFEHASLATRSSFPVGGEPDPATPHCDINFSITITLGTGLEESTNPRSVHIFASAPYSTEPHVDDQYGYASVLVESNPI